MLQIRQLMTLAVSIFYLIFFLVRTNLESWYFSVIELNEAKKCPDLFNKVAFSIKLWGLFFSQVGT